MITEFVRNGEQLDKALNKEVPTGVATKRRVTTRMSTRRSAAADADAGEPNRGEAAQELAEELEALTLHGAGLALRSMGPRKRCMWSIPRGLSKWVGEPAGPPTIVKEPESLEVTSNATLAASVNPRGGASETASVRRARSAQGVVKGLKARPSRGVRRWL